MGSGGSVRLNCLDIAYTWTIRNKVKLHYLERGIFQDDSDQVHRAPEVCQWFQESDAGIIHTSITRSQSNQTFMILAVINSNNKRHIPPVELLMLFDSVPWPVQAVLATHHQLPNKHLYLSVSTLLLEYLQCASNILLRTIRKKRFQYWIFSTW